MKWPLETKRDWAIALALLALGALLLFPNLRTNPNWYSDEGEWMEMSWTLAHGQPRIGALKNDFLFPYPYPPLYLLVNGVLLRVFGYDISVSRALGGVTALAAAAILFWIGTRLRSRDFGFLCAAGFLVYPEMVVNFRWVRSHPMAGTFALASVGFLICYVQERRLCHVVWAGVLCSLATATNYFTYPLVGCLILTVCFVNWRNWRHVLIGAVTGGAYLSLFVLWYGIFQPGGWTQLMEQVGRVGGFGAQGSPNIIGEIVRWYRNLVTFGLLTPTTGPGKVQYVDVWLIAATLGVVFFPEPRFRKWLVLWLLALMYEVFKKLNNVPIFFYPATIFLPLMAVGFAGAMTSACEWTARLVPRWPAASRALPAVVLIVCGLASLNGSLGHFRTKVDLWTIHSPADAETTMEFINANTTEADLVLIPKHIYWLANKTRKSMLIHCATYERLPCDVFPEPIPRKLFWFDSYWRNAKFLVLAYGRDSNGRPYGFDAVYTLGLKGPREVMQAIQNEKWPTVYQQGEFIVLANPRFMDQGGKP